MKNKAVVLIGFFSLATFCFSYLFSSQTAVGFGEGPIKALDRVSYRMKCKTKKLRKLKRVFDREVKELSALNLYFKESLEEEELEQRSLIERALAPGELGALQSRLLGHSLEGKWKLESMKSFPGFLGEFETHYMDLRFSGSYEEIRSWLTNLQSANLPLRVIHLHIGQKELSEEAILEVGIETLIHPDGGVLVN